MKNFKLIFLAVGCGLLSVNSYAACLQQNFTQCLDSACATNIGTNPAARCQLCGTSDAGTEKSGMSSITLGMSAKNTLTAAQLKSAPSGPAEKYAWAIKECSKKISGCTADDTGEYDKLIEQSCRAASINIQMSSAQKSANAQKDKTTCEAEINICVRDNKKCGADFSACRDDTDFNRVFSECSVGATGCSEFTNNIRDNNISARDSAVKNSAAIILKIVAAHKAAREDKIAMAHADCKDNSAYDKCVASVCAQNMKNGCASGFPSETTMAKQLCKFQSIACERLK